MHVILQPGLSVFDAARAYLKEGETAALFGRLDEVILGADLSQPEGRINLTGEIHVKADIFYTREGPRLFAVACWADHGVLRSASGLLIGGRICAAELFQGGEGIKATPPDPVEAAIEPPQPRPAARISRARPVKRAAEPSPSAPTESEGHTEVDLSPELAELAPIPTPQPAALGWAAAVAASQRTVTAAIAAQSQHGAVYTGALIVGDLLIHPRYGRCRVTQPPQSGKVRLRKAAGGFFELHLKTCALIQQADEDERRVFRVKIGRD